MLLTQTLSVIPASVRLLLGGSILVLAAMLAASVYSIVFASIAVFLLTTLLALPLLNLESEWACLVAGAVGALSVLGVGVPWLLCSSLPLDGLCGCFDTSTDNRIRFGVTVTIFVVSFVAYAAFKGRRR
jgi:hypothetical protein